MSRSHRQHSGHLAQACRHGRLPTLCPFHGHVTPDLALVLSKTAPWGSQKETALTFGKRRQGPSEYGLSDIRSSAGMVA